MNTINPQNHGTRDLVDLSVFSKKERDLKEGPVLQSIADCVDIIPDLSNFPLTYAELDSNAIENILTRPFVREETFDYGPWKEKKAKSEKVDIEKVLKTLPAHTSPKDMQQAFINAFALLKRVVGGPLYKNRYCSDVNYNVRTKYPFSAQNHNRVQTIRRIGEVNRYLHDLCGDFARVWFEALQEVRIKFPDIKKFKADLKFYKGRRPLNIIPNPLLMSFQTKSGIRKLYWCSGEKHVGRYFTETLRPCGYL